MPSITTPTFLGLDVHKNTISAGILRPGEEVPDVEKMISVSVPERRYALAAELLARAVERASGSASDLHVGDLLSDVARVHGHDIGRDLRSSPTGASAGDEGLELIERLVGLLIRHGYEPRLADGVITMANCPFHALAEEHCDLVCHMNHELLSGVAEGAGLVPEAVRLDPEPGRCCVTIVA